MKSLDYNKQTFVEQVLWPWQGPEIKTQEKNWVKQIY